MKNIIKWNEIENLDKFFNNFFSNNEFIENKKMSFNGYGSVNVYTEKDSMVIEMDVPGVDSSDLDISLEDQYLTISGKRNEEKEEKEKNYYKKEISRGNFKRTITLPTKKLDNANIQAVLKNGVLRLSIPKAIKEKKKIEIISEE